MSTALKNASFALLDGDVDRTLSVDRLMLSDFRCYETLRLRADARPIVVTGPNGAGKTNLLEAVSYLSAGRGLRGARMADIARESRTAAGTLGRAASWAVAAEVRTPRGPVSIGSGWSAAADDGSGREGRAVKVDGKPASGQAALSEHVWMAWLTPAMDRLFVEAPAGRRRFLDGLVAGFDPAHAGRVQRYDRTRRERSRLLREARVDASWLGALERSMAESAVAIAAARLDLVERLKGALGEGEDPFPRPDIAVHGWIEERLLTSPALAVEERYRARLEAERPSDAESGTCEGVHRSDLAAWFPDSGMAAEHASTGEQKAMLIAIVLAHGRLLARARGAAPILLLDEVAAHLDGHRRAALFQAILDLGAQAWLTGTDKALFAPLAGDARFFAVEAAVITEESPLG